MSTHPTEENSSPSKHLVRELRTGHTRGIPKAEDHRIQRRDLLGELLH